MKKTKRNVPSRHVVYCFVEICSQNTVKLCTNVEKGYNSLPLKVLEQCWLRLSIILNPNLTILWEFSTIYTGFVFPAAYFKSMKTVRIFHYYLVFF